MKKIYSIIALSLFGIAFAGCSDLNDSTSDHPHAPNTPVHDDTPVVTPAKDFMDKALDKTSPEIIPKQELVTPSAPEMTSNTEKENDHDDTGTAPHRH